MKGRSPSGIMALTPVAATRASAVFSAAPSSAFMRVPRPRARTTAFTAERAHRRRQAPPSSVDAQPLDDFRAMGGVVFRHHRRNIAERHHADALLLTGARPVFRSNPVECFEVRQPGAAECVDALGE